MSGTQTTDTTNQNNSTVNTNATSNQSGTTNTAQNGATSSQTGPWQVAQPTLSSIISALNPLVGSSGLTSTQQTAINQLSNQTNPYTSQIGASANNLLNGGGANNQSPLVNSAIQAYQAQTSPLASNTNYDPMNTPGLATALQGLNNNITSQVNGQFAAAGRDGSPANSQALAYGLAQGEAPLITQQYNTDVANQQAAANSLYGNTVNAGNALFTYNNQANQNQLSGTNQANNYTSANAYGPTSALTAQQYLQSIPTQNLASLSGIASQIAGLGSQSSGTSSATGSNTSNLTGTNTGTSVGNSSGSGTSTTSTPWYSGLQAMFGGGSNSAAAGILGLL